MLGGCCFIDLEMAAKRRQIDGLVTEVNALRAGQGACTTDDKPRARGASGSALSTRRGGPASDLAWTRLMTSRSSVGLPGGVWPRVPAGCRALSRWSAPWTRHLLARAAIDLGQSSRGAGVARRQRIGGLRFPRPDGAADDVFVGLAYVRARKGAARRAGTFRHRCALRRIVALATRAQGGRLARERRPDRGALGAGAGRRIEARRP
jgi:hypothetical protein